MLSNRFIHTAAVFFVIGVATSIRMAWYGDVSLGPLQLHLSLLGWTSLAIIGLLYAIYPHLERGWAAGLHYWLHTLGLLLFTVGAATELEPSSMMTAVGGSMLGLGAVIFAFNVFSQLRASRHGW